jgi:hypothetical protein
MWLSESPFTSYELQIGDNLSSGLCWGGTLVRYAGWWSLPGLVQAGIDTAWTALISAAGFARYTPQVIVEHKNWRTGKRPVDEVDDWSRNGVDYIKRDIEFRDRWVASDDYRRLLTSIIVEANLPLTPFQEDRMRQMVRDSYTRERWKPGMPGVRLQAALDWVDANLDELISDLHDSHADAQPAR